MDPQVLDGQAFVCFSLAGEAPTTIPDVLRGLLKPFEIAPFFLVLSLIAHFEVETSVTFQVPTCGRVDIDLFYGQMINYHHIR